MRRIKMAAEYFCFVIIANIFGLCLCFYQNENTITYGDLVNDNLGTPELNCRCATDVALCECKFHDKVYMVDAPFATLLEDLSPTTTWPGTNSYQMPDGFPRTIRVLKGTEAPLPEVKVMPRDFDVIRARFKLFFKENNAITTARRLWYNDLDNWKHPKFNSPRKVYVVIHGWTASDVDMPIRSLRAYLLLRDTLPNTALISVNWNAAATGSYRQSAADTLVISRQIGLLVFELVKSKRMKASDIHLIGIDMGSHIAKLTADVYYKLANQYNIDSPSSRIESNIGRRTGFNPFATYFSGIEQMSSISDAIDIDIIHTTTAEHGGSIEDILNRNYGVSTLHHNLNSQADFYPNKGIWSAVCDDNSYGCGLYTAIKFFKASLLNGYDRTKFASYAHPGMKRNAEGEIISPQTGVMGIDVEHGTKGNQFLEFTVPDQPLLPVQPFAKNPPCEPGPSSIQPDPQSFTRCGTSNSPVQRIKHGVDPMAEQFPWTVCMLTNTINYVGENVDGAGQIIGSDFWPREAADDWIPVDDKTTRVQTGYSNGCVGTLLEPGWVLTAAHCFKDVKNLIPIYLVFGTTDCFKPSQGHRNVRRVVIEKREGSNQTVFIHDSYPQSEDLILEEDGDIALIRLPEPVVPSLFHNIWPICYREAVNYPYGDCSRIQVAGYGLKGDGQADSRLTWLRANLVDPDSPRHSFVNRPKYGLNMQESFTRGPETFQLASFEEYDANYPEGRAVCHGDSGGPIMDYSLGDGKRATIIGIVRGGEECSISTLRQRRDDLDPTYVESYGESDCWSIFPTIGTKVSSYVGWITTIIAVQDYTDPEDRFHTPLAGELGTGPQFAKYRWPVRQNRPYLPNSWYEFEP